jgi:hypothetical protein
MVEVVETPEAKLKRHEDALVACMAEITKLRAENARLRSSEAESASALSTLRMIMRDDSQPANVRVRAATAALACETPRLTPVPPPLDLTASEEPIEPLATVVERGRARANRMLALPLEERSALITGVRRNGNGQDDDTGS